MHFYPRSPCGERLPAFWLLDSNAGISIHALLAESDSGHNFRGRVCQGFLSTLSLRRATKIPYQCKIDQENFYPRSPCGERRPHRQKNINSRAFLSTLSLRRATWLRCWQLAARDISIHALLAESDVVHALKFADLVLFLSTLSLRRATLAGPSGPAFLFNFYPRSPCGERLTSSIVIVILRKFLSTLSLRRATSSGNSCTQALPISIHALLAESDVVHALKFADLVLFLSTLSLRRATRLCTILYSCPGNFYPRSPCGERPTVHQ